MTSVIVNMLVCVPNIVVVIEGSDEITSPLRLQVIEIGLSPFRIKHAICADSPWFIASVPNEKGTISGGSANKIIQYLPNIIYH